MAYGRVVSRCELRGQLRTAYGLQSCLECLEVFRGLVRVPLQEGPGVPLG